MKDKMMRRHTRIAIFMHWFNAVCWLILLATGLGLINNPALSPVGTWWPETLQSLFGGGGYLLYAHIFFGLLWAIVFIVYGLVKPRWHLLVFFKEIFAFSPKRDLQWLIRKGLGMTLGKSFMKKLKIEPKLPEQGFYNVGQKMFAIPATLGGIIIVVTGVIMALSRYIDISILLVQWSILLHFLTVGLVFAGLLIHIYMAAIVTEERPAFKSMFSGFVPEEFAKHHNYMWYQQQKDFELKN